MKSPDLRLPKGTSRMSLLLPGHFGKKAGIFVHGACVNNNLKATALLHLSIRSYF